MAVGFIQKNAGVTGKRYPLPRYTSGMFWLSKIEAKTYPGIHFPKANYTFRSFTDFVKQ